MFIFFNLLFLLFSQERLEHMAHKFERKAALRDSWLKEMNSVLQDFDFGRTVAQVEAALKKQQAIAADILPQVNFSICTLWIVLGNKNFDVNFISSLFLGVLSWMHPIMFFF